MRGGSGGSGRLSELAGLDACSGRQFTRLGDGGELARNRGCDGLRRQSFCCLEGFRRLESADNSGWLAGMLLATWSTQHSGQAARIEGEECCEI